MTTGLPLAATMTSPIGDGEPVEGWPAVGGMEGYLNLKSYYEFDASRRPEFAITPAVEPPLQHFGVAIGWS